MNLSQSFLSKRVNFSDVYNICVAIPEPMSDKLYNSLVKCIEDHVEELRTVSDHFFLWFSLKIAPDWVSLSICKLPEHPDGTE